MKKELTVGERLKALEKKHQLTSAEMSRRIGISYTQYIDARSGRFGLTSWKRIALLALEKFGINWLSKTE